MAVAVLFTPAAMTVDQYVRVIGQLAESGAGAPPGRRFHACFGPAHQLTMFDVWDSLEEFHAFATTLTPILAKEQIEIALPEPREIHNIIESSDTSALRKRIEDLRERSFFRRPAENLGDRLHQITESGVVAKLREKMLKAKKKPSDEEGIEETTRS